ncbi:MAG: AmmeMemoRadiSam system protein B [Verrucomicrobia bacterium]|nr:AmmeMemoRadiSam system protein B [Verrucomicrobiota bacterium]
MKPGTLTIRSPAVAGRFYPSEPGGLKQTVRTLLQQARCATSVAPKAMIAPHAGYVYSGPIAASAFVTLTTLPSSIRRVVLLGPSHQVAFNGLALCRAETWVTPLGPVPVDLAAVERIRSHPAVKIFEPAHALEHCLEVELPFLQQTVPTFAVVPIVVGDASDQAVSEVLELLWGGPETCIVVSSDLSHYYEYETACQLDRAAARAIESLAPEGVQPEHACGRIPIRGLLRSAREHGLAAATLDLRNSGDTAGSRDSVVGYGAFVFTGND